jgi:hypothetical protein
VRGNVRHWALYLQTSSGSWIYQVTGEPTAFTYGHREGVDPANSSRFVESIFVSEIDRGDVDAVKKILKNFPVQNDVATWSCQDWVLEALEALKDEELVDESTFFSAQEELQAGFNE